MQFPVKIRISILSTVCLSSLVAVSDAAAAGYQITDLGSLGSAGYQTRAMAINNNGRVAGSVQTSSGYEHGFTAEPNGSGFLDTGSVGATGSSLSAINNGGDAAGSSALVNGYIQAVKYKNGQGLQVLGTLGGRDSYGTAINNNGDVAGYAQNASLHTRAFRFSAGGMKDLGTLGGNQSIAWDINNNGKVVGSAEESYGVWLAFYHDGNTMVSLGSLGQNSSVATAINDSGIIVGTAADSAWKFQAFRYINHAMTALPGLGGWYSVANDINNGGAIVGSSIDSNWSMRAVKWEGGQPADLNALIPANSGWFLAEARRINDKGQILGFGYLNNQASYFLLTPDNTHTPVHKIEYDLVPLTGLTDVYEINKQGHVAGGGTGADNWKHAMLWNGQSYIDYGLVGCRTTVSYCESVGFGLNDSDQLTGHSNRDNYFSAYYQFAVAILNGKMTTIPTLGNEYSRGESINNLNHIAGHGRATFAGANYEVHAFYWDGTSTYDLGTLGGRTSFAYALNDDEIIVGKADGFDAATALPVTRAVRWVNKGVQDLGTLGGLNSAAYDINSGGAIVGDSATPAGESHAFLWTPNKGMTDIGMFVPAALNNKNHVVGTANHRAVVWRGQSVTDLNNLIDTSTGWELWDARDINDDGQIIGHGNKGAYLLKPR